MACGAAHTPGPAHSAITHRGLVSPGSRAKLPSNSPRWMNRRCYMWTGCQNDLVISLSLRCLKMLTHCVWGTNVSLEVMEAFSLFFLQTAFISWSVHSSVEFIFHLPQTSPDTSCPFPAPSQVIWFKSFFQFINSSHNRFLLMVLCQGCLSVIFFLRMTKCQSGWFTLNGIYGKICYTAPFF